MILWFVRSKEYIMSFFIVFVFVFGVLNIGILSSFIFFIGMLFVSAS